MAAAKAGLVLVTINPALRAHEVEYILKQGAVRALFFMAKIRDHDCLETIRELTTPGTLNGAVTSARRPLLRFVSLVGLPLAGLLEQDGWRPTLFSEVAEARTTMSDAALEARQAAVRPSDPAMLLYTSGTTGFPKEALLTQRGVLNNALGQMRRLEVVQADRFCAPMPFFHAMGCVLGVLGALAAGGALHPLIAFDPLKAMQIISRKRCTGLAAVPTMLFAILQHPQFGDYDLSSLRIVGSGGAPVPVALMEQVKARIGADVAIGFGQTEASCAITLTPPDDSFELKAATVGLPLPHVAVKIIDPASDAIVPCGERGELCLRGYLVMQGYYEMPEKTAETIDEEGWLHTGDLATMNAQGYLNIVGRLKEMVIRGGENLFPAEIEAFLLRHPKVAAVAVLGVPDRYFGEELLAAVRPKAGEILTEEELRAFCQGQISHQKIPRYFQFVESFPLTGSGKVQKFVLREQAIKTLGLEHAAQIKTA
jgi:fatty-acyl-CoA synthase